jgi:archaellum component FlaF (FlaF/FlaG flagellin family)
MKRTFLVLCLAPVMLLAEGTSNEGYLKVNVTPDKAGVFLDGVYMGPAARFAHTLKYKLPPGKYQITMSDPRCEDATVSVTIEAGKTAEVPPTTLKPKPEPKGPFGLIKVIAPNNVGGVFLNGEYVGHVDEFDNSVEGLLVPPGTYTVLIEAAGGDGLLEESVTVVADKTVVVQQTPTQ